ncbi:MAG TPA: UDP-N-acetylglucosamine 2-epimerase (hydrolyzing) [Spirochaetia bacterium]|nr:UDP-N-acetylglucosamine 2-epimerase (hydrolyzing) [Spirochaetia bacterium]
MKKICILTGTRAEYGLLKPLLDALRRSREFKTDLIVTGSHLSPEFGLTWKEIQKDRIPISEKIDILLSSDSASGTVKSMGLALLGLADAYARLKPHLVILLGDRYETFCAAAAALPLRIPVAHLHGGEVTEGAIDDAFRHAITKLSLLHFCSCTSYRRRIIQLGEDPRRVFVTGAIGLDNIRNLKLLTKPEFEKQTGFIFKKKNFLVTFHPATLENASAGKQFAALLAVLEKQKECGIIITMANADAGGRQINSLAVNFIKKYPHHAKVFTSLGRQRYLSALKMVDAVIGNSSSGIIEAPSFKTATINIGDRQRGRIMAESIISCRPFAADISRALDRLYSSEFQAKLKKTRNPYGNGRAAQKIISILQAIKFPPDTRKKFFNL